MTSTSSDADEDAPLLERLRDGDTAALDALMRRYWSPIVAYLVRIGASREGAEDVAQRAFYRLWERRSSWQPDGSPRGLIYRIARNFAVSEHRTELARARADAEGGEERAEIATPLEVLENEELHGALERAIRSLPPRRREVFVLRFVHDLSYREIAEIMGTSPQTVANQLSSALSALRQLLRPLLER